VKAQEPLSIHAPLNRLRLGFHIHPQFDRRSFPAVLLVLGAILLGSAWIHLTAPASELRFQYLPPQMSLAEGLTAAVPETLAQIGNLFHPYLLGPALAVFFMARRFGVCATMETSTLRRMLLLPLAFFLVTAHTGATASIIAHGLVIARVEHYITLTGFAAAVCCAVYFAARTESWLGPARPRACARRSLPIVVGLLVLGLAIDPIYREAVNEALVTGPVHARGNVDRIRILSAQGGGVVEIPELELPPPMIPAIGHTSDTEVMYEDHLARSFDKARVIFIPCGTGSTPDRCHYIDLLEAGRKKIEARRAQGSR
jgi:hypothetical protein